MGNVWGRGEVWVGLGDSVTMEHREASPWMSSPHIQPQPLLLCLTAIPPPIPSPCPGDKCIPVPSSALQPFPPIPSPHVRLTNAFPSPSPHRSHSPHPITVHPCDNCIPIPPFLSYSHPPPIPSPHVRMTSGFPSPPLHCGGSPSSHHCASG